MSDIVRKAGGLGVIERVEVVPTLGGPLENAMRAVSKEMARLSVKAASDRGLTVDEAGVLVSYVKTLKEMRALQKDLDAESSVNNLTLDELRALAHEVLAALAVKEGQEKKP
jgi:hypothetical protein